jgi:hypothetical protein
MCREGTCLSLKLHSSGRGVLQTSTTRLDVGNHTGEVLERHTVHSFRDETFHEASALSISMSIQIRIKLKLLKCRKEKMNFTAEGARVGQPNC